MFHKSLLLTGLAVLPTLSSIPVNANTSQEVQVEEKQADEPESCTIMYVGKDISESGKAIMARCGDSSPAGMNMHTQIFAHNQLANVTVKGSKGFSWTMPSTTYKYIATPRNPLVHNGLHWEVSAINEKGVAVSATLTCNPNHFVEDYDKLLPKDGGITEDNIAQIVGATAATAKEGILTIANIISTIGNGEPNAIMVMDKNEVWYMEMYSGHQYIAIKMPSNQACTIGNEFMLNTVYELKTTYGLSDDDIICSKDLFELPADKGFAKYDGLGTTNEHMHLYNTYAGHGETGQGNFTNGCHMRTWRGRDLYAKAGQKQEYFVDDSYIPTTKYAPFWAPEDGTKLSVRSVIDFMRDRYENIIADKSTHSEHDKFIEIKKRELRGLRVVGTNATYQVHIISVDPNMPAETSVTEWMALSSANYTPFIPFNNGMDKLNSYYSYVIPNYGLDENAACCVFKKLNVLADTDRTNYGLPTQNYIADHEDVWQKQYDQLINQIKTLSLSTQKDVLSNYCCYMQDVAITMSKVLFDDLTWHTTNLPSPTTKKPIPDLTFYPLIRPDYYGYMYGWDYSINNNIITLKQGSDTITIDCNSTQKPETGWDIGTLTKNSETPVETRIKVKDGVYYLDYREAKTYLSANHTLRDMNYKDFISVSNNNSSWVIPVAITVPIVVLAASVAPVMAFTSSKKKKIHIKK